MADNYIEDKLEKLGSSRPVIRHVNASLDSLLKEAGSAYTSVPEGYVVKQAQSDAMIFSARRLGIPFTASCPDPSTIRICCADMLSLGEIVLAVRLKAAEMKLRASVGGTAPAEGNGCEAEISIYK